MRAVVIVLGDLARSPRTVNHAVALAAHGVEVDLIGYVDTTLPQSVTRESAIRVHALADPARTSAASTSRRAWAVRALRRGVGVSMRLTRLLLVVLPRHQLIVVQNPPGVPVLLIAWLAARLRGARLVIDWHNLSHSMLALRVGASHALVRSVARFEAAMGRRAHLNIFVSATMARDLATRWRLEGRVFRDRPAASFVPASDGERVRTRHVLLQELDVAPPHDRVALLISPTSWTDDEDASLVLDAVERYEAAATLAEATGATPAHLLLLMTGDGPRRRWFEGRVAGRTLTHVSVRTQWFTAERYPTILAAAHLGVCLHRSTSGLDLPMKVADMMGAGVPCCALDYGSCLGEIIEPNRDGLLFKTADDLASHWMTLLGAWPDTRALDKLRRGVLEQHTGAGARTWQQAWEGELRDALLE